MTNQLVIVAGIVRMLFLTHYKLLDWPFPQGTDANVAVVLGEQKYRFHILRATKRGRSRHYVVSAREHKPSEIVTDVLTGKIASTPSQQYPSLPEFPIEYTRFVMQVHADLDLMATRTLLSMAWRTGIHLKAQMLSSDPYVVRWREGSFEQPIVLFSKGWQPVKFDVRMVPEAVRNDVAPSKRPTADIAQNHGSVAEDVAALLSTEMVPPVGHSLLQEAWRNHELNARSAIVMAVAAVETAMKECAADLCPDARWLIRNLQSPPVYKMMGKWLPHLRARESFAGRVIAPPRVYLKKIQRATEIRNGVVHGVAADQLPIDLEDLLHAIEDCLYLLDYYRGNLWALDRMSAEFVQAIQDECKLGN